MFAASGLGIAALLAAGYAGKLTDGAPWRFGPELRGLLDARADYFGGRGRACGERTGDIAAAATPEEAAARACRIGPEAGPARFALWGDSLAMALQPAVEEAARAAGVGGLALAGRPARRCPASCVATTPSPANARNSTRWSCASSPSRRSRR